MENRKLKPQPENKSTPGSAEKEGTGRPHGKNDKKVLIIT